MPRQSSQSNQSAAPSPSDSNGEFERSTAYIPSIIGDGPLDAPVEQPIDNGVNSLIPPELIAQALGPSFQAIFRAVATQRGAHWELQDFEKTALIQGWTPIVQTLLAKLGNSEQVMITLAVASTVAIVGGKVAQDASKRVSSTASTRMRKSEASSASSASVEAARQPEQNSSFEGQDEL
jgi:hypothetical protein